MSARGAIRPLQKEILARIRPPEGEPEVYPGAMIWKGKRICPPTSWIWSGGSSPGPPEKSRPFRKSTGVPKKNMKLHRDVEFEYTQGIATRTELFFNLQTEHHENITSKLRRNVPCCDPLCPESPE
jgi:hypothetical protein